MKWTHATGAVAAAAIAAVATAGIGAPVSFDLNSLTQSAAGTVEDFTLEPYAWGSIDFLDPNPTNGIGDGFFIGVDSGDSSRAGFDYELTLDYSAYDIGFFGGDGTHAITMTDVYSGNPGAITDVFVKDSNGLAVGNFSTDGASIFWDASIDDVLKAIGPAEDQVITIQFAVIPAPGVLAVFGVAGLAGTRRRRA